MFAQPIHTDVFVSYRRLDVDFVKSFVDGLKAEDKEVWVDWEDLPPGGAEFTEDIRRGIESSDSFVAILSPDYLESTYCVDLELGYAIELNKKIIPVVYRKFEDYPVPPAISHINWIYFTPHAGQENKFEESMPRVIEAIEVDFAYVRDHTRLLQRAREWDTNNRRNSYLLTGDEVTVGETFLMQSATKDPSATEIHHEFIHASRGWENQKVRRNLIIAVSVTILSIVLAAFALVQRQRAVEQQAIAEQQRAIAVEQQTIAEQQRAIAVEERNRAEEQQQLSDSRRLAVQSLVALDDGAVDLSLLLSLEALDSAETLAAIGSLVTVFEDNPYLDTYLYAHDAPLTSVIYHPNELLMVTGAEDGSISVWDMEDLTITHQISEHNSDVWDMDFHPDGDQFAVAFEDGAIELYTADGTELLERIENAHEGIITSLNYSSTGEQFITTSYDSNAKLWDAETLEPRLLAIDDTETTHIDWILDSVFSPTGEQVALMTWDNVVQIWDVASGTLVFDPILLPVVGSNFSVAIAWSPDGRSILTGDVLGTIRFVDATSGTLIDFVLSRHRDHIREIVYSPDGTFFASVSHDGTTILWNAINGQPITDAPIRVHSNQVNGVTFSPDGEQMITVGDDGRAVLFDMTRPDLLGELVLTQDSEIFAVITMDDGDILSTGLDGNVYLTDGESYDSVILIEPDIGRITAASLSADETVLAIATDAGVMQLWDIETENPLSDAFTAHSATIFALKISPDGTQLASAGDDQKIVIWSLDDLQNDIFDNFVPLEGHSDGIFDVAWHPTLPLIASGSRDNTIRLWDLDTVETIRILEGHTDDIEVVVFDPFGEILVSGGRDNNIIMWNIESALSDDDILSELLGSHKDWVLSMAFSSEGDSLVSGGRDRAITVWDIERLQPYGESLIFHDSWVWAVAISVDELSIVSGGRDGRLVVWNADVDSWVELACNIANRSLNPDEWLQYRPDTDYVEFCD